MQEQFEVSGSSFDGCGRDAERRLFECFENLLRLYSSDSVLTDKGLNSFWCQVMGFTGIKKQLQELAEERVQSLVPRSERNEVRPTSC